MINWQEYKNKLQSYHCKACYEPFISLKLVLQDEQLEKSLTLIEDFLSNKKKTMFQILLCESCDILIHSKCRGSDEDIINKTIKIELTNNKEYILDVGFVVCAGCQFKERKNKEARCFECFNEAGYLTGLVNDNTRDRMVHPICAVFNRRFHIKTPENLGLSLTNKYQRETVQDQKCFKCDKKINYKYKCPDEECLVYMHYYCLMEERTVQILADDDKFSEFLWNFSYSFSSQNYELKGKMPRINIVDSQQLFEIEEDPNSIDIQIKQKIANFKNKYQQTPQIEFRCNQHPVMGRNQCICQQRVDDTSVICDYCSLWYHAKCFDIDVDSEKGYTCQKCSLLIEINNKSSLDKIIDQMDSYITKIFKIYTQFEFSFFDIFRLAEFFFHCIQHKQDPLLLKNACFFFSVLDQFNWTKSLFQQFFNLNHQYLKTQKIKQFMLKNFSLCMQQKENYFQNIQNDYQKILQEIQNQVQKYFTMLEKISKQQKDTSHFLFEIQKNEFYENFRKLIQSLISNAQGLDQFYKNLIELQKLTIDSNISPQIDVCLQNIHDLVKSKKIDKSINPLVELHIENMYQVILYFILQKLVKKNSLQKLESVQRYGSFDQEEKQNFYYETVKFLSIKEIDLNNPVNFYYYFSLHIQDKMKFKEDIEEFLQNYYHFQNEDLYRQINMYNLPTKKDFQKDCNDYVIQEIKGNTNLSVRQLQKFMENAFIETKAKQKLGKFLQQINKKETEIKTNLQKYIQNQQKEKSKLEEKIMQQIDKLKVQSMISKLAQSLIEINKLWNQQDDNMIVGLIQNLGVGLDIEYLQGIFDFSNYFLKDKIIDLIINKQQDIEGNNLQQYYQLERLKAFFQNANLNQEIKAVMKEFIQYQKLLFVQKIKDFLFKRNSNQISIKNLNKIHQNVLQLLKVNIKFNNQQLSYINNINKLCILTKFYIEFFYQDIQPKEQLDINLGIFIKDTIERVLYQENYDEESKIDIMYKSMSTYVKLQSVEHQKRNQLFQTYEQLLKYPSVDFMKSIIQQKIFDYKIFDSFKKEIKKRINKSQNLFKELRYSYEKYCLDKDVNQLGIMTQIQFENIKTSLQEINCINPQIIYLFLALQKKFVFQLITQKKTVSIEHLRQFEQLYKDKKILPQLNSSISEFFQKLKKLEQIKTDLDIVKIYEIKEVFNNEIFNGYINQSKKLKFYKNIIRLCFDEQNKIKLEDYIDKSKKILEKSTEFEVIFSKDLWQLINQPIDFYQKVQGNMLKIDNEKRYFSQVLIKLIEDGKIKSIKYLENFLQGQKSIIQRIIQAQNLENLAFSRFNQELEYISLVPDLIQVAFIMFHVRNVLRSVLSNDGRENIITINDLKQYYNTFIKLSQDLANYEFFKNSFDVDFANQEKQQKVHQKYRYNLQDLIDKFYLEFLLIFIQCEKYEKGDIKDLKYLIKSKDKNIKFQIEDHKQLSHINVNINRQFLEKIMINLQMDEVIQEDFEKFDYQINLIYQKIKEQHKKSIQNFKQFIIQRNETEINLQLNRILNAKTFDISEENFAINNENFDKMKLKILKAQKKVTQKSDGDFIKRLQNSIETNKYSKFNMSNSSMQLKSFLRIFKDNIEKEENFSRESAKQLQIFFQETDQINEIIGGLLNLKTNVKLILQSCTDYYKNKQIQDKQKSENLQKFDKKKKKFVLNLPGQKKPKKNTLLDSLLNNKNDIKNDKASKLVQSANKTDFKKNPLFKKQIEESDDDSLQELKINKKKIPKKQNYICQYSYNPLQILIKKKQGNQVNLSLDLYTGQSQKFIEYYKSSIFIDVQLKQISIDDLFVNFINKKIKNQNDCFIFYTYIKNEDFWDTYRENQVLNFYNKIDNYKMFLVNFVYFLEQEIDVIQYLNFQVQEDIFYKIGDLKNLFFLICVKPKDEGIQENCIQLNKIQGSIINTIKAKDLIKEKLQKNPLYDKQKFLKQFENNEKPQFKNIIQSQIQQKQQNMRPNPTANVLPQNALNQQSQFQRPNNYFSNQIQNVQNFQQQNNMYQQFGFQQQQQQQTYENNINQGQQSSMNFYNNQARTQIQQNIISQNNNQRNFPRPPPPPPSRQ